MKSKPGLVGHEGFMIIEILIASVIFGIAVIGFTIMLSWNQGFVVGQGDTRVNTYLAQQKLEKLTALGFSNVPTGNMTTSGCPTGEPCYSETFSPSNTTPNGLGLGQQTPAANQLDRQTFTRKTCVRYVQDDDPTKPASTLDPTTWTCTSCTQGSPASCTLKTKRATVAVYPTTSESSRFQGDLVTIETVLTQ